MALLKVSKKASIDTIYACLKSFLETWIISVLESKNMVHFATLPLKSCCFKIQSNCNTILT